jgi:hypothetical protein
MRGLTRRLAAGLLAAALPAGSAAESIGLALKVHPGVTGRLQGGEVRPLVVNDPIERGVLVQLTGREAFLLVAFSRFGCLKLAGPHSHQFAGTASFDGKTEVELGEVGSLISEIQLLYGKLQMALNHDDGGCPPVAVKTPHAAIGVTGTYLRVRVDPVAGTFVAVDEGTVTVQAAVGGAPVSVKAGSWVLVPPGGLPTRPTPLPPDDGDDILQDPPLLGCCSGTEPPKPPGHPAAQGPP